MVVVRNADLEVPVAAPGLYDLAVLPVPLIDVANRAAAALHHFASIRAELLLVLEPQREAREVRSQAPLDADDHVVPAAAEGPGNMLESLVREVEVRHVAVFFINDAAQRDGPLRRLPEPERFGRPDAVHALLAHIETEGRRGHRALSSQVRDGQKARQSGRDEQDGEEALQHIRGSGSSVGRGLRYYALTAAVTSRPPG